MTAAAQQGGELRGADPAFIIMGQATAVTTIFPDSKQKAATMTSCNRNLRRSAGSAFSLLFGAALVAAGAANAAAQEYLTGIEWQKPPIVTPGKGPGDPPSDAVILFDGKDMSAWKGAENWKVGDGFVTVGRGMIESKEKFGDCQLHVEWSAPVPAVGESQERGNSGVFFGPYELQVLDSYGNETYFDGQAGAIYKQRPPLANAMRPPGEWNVYDVIWTTPTFNADGTLKSPAYITAIHNGVVIQNHFQLLGDTPYNRPPQYADTGKLAIQLQDHGNPVRYRNIWVREWKPLESKQAREPYIKNGDQETPVSEAAVAK